jgi:hypothetical protein
MNWNEEDQYDVLEPINLKERNGIPDLSLKPGLVVETHGCDTKDGRPRLVPQRFRVHSDSEGYFTMELNVFEEGNLTFTGKISVFRLWWWIRMGKIKFTGSYYRSYSGGDAW